MNLNPFKKKRKEPDLSDLDFNSENSKSINSTQMDSPFKLNENEDSFGNPINKNRYENQDFSSPFPATGTSIQPPPQNNGLDSKDIQLILAKLDTIKSEITNINHRLDNIERRQPQQQQQRYRW